MSWTRRSDSVRCGFTSVQTMMGLRSSTQSPIALGRNCFAGSGWQTFSSRQLSDRLGPSLEYGSVAWMSNSLGKHDAFLVSVFLKDIVDHECWYDGRPLPVEAWDAGKTYVFDLR